MDLGGTQGFSLSRAAKRSSDKKQRLQMLKKQQKQDASKVKATKKLLSGASGCCAAADFDCESTGQADLDCEWWLMPAMLRNRPPMSEMTRDLPTIPEAAAADCESTGQSDLDCEWWLMPAMLRNRPPMPVSQMTRDLPTIPQGSLKTKLRAGMHRTSRRLSKKGATFDPEVRAASAKKDSAAATLRELIRIAALIALEKQSRDRKSWRILGNCFSNHKRNPWSWGEWYTPPDTRSQHSNVVVESHRRGFDHFKGTESLLDSLLQSCDVPEDLYDEGERVSGLYYYNIDGKGHFETVMYDSLLDSCSKLPADAVHSDHVDQKMLHEGIPTMSK